MVRNQRETKNGYPPPPRLPNNAAVTDAVTVTFMFFVDAFLLKSEKGYLVMVNIIMIYTWCSLCCRRRALGLAWGRGSWAKSVTHACSSFCQRLSGETSRAVSDYSRRFGSIQLGSVVWFRGTESNRMFFAIKRTEPNRTKPNRIEPNRTKNPNRTEPNRTKKPNRTNFACAVPNLTDL